jgi:carbon monoxide dehydrogenase subunit G
MEVELNRKYPLAVSAARAWAVLSDIRAVAGCMPGAQITEQVDDTHYKGIVKSKVGPAAMTFAGDIEVLELVEGERRLAMLGKGADKGGSSAAMKLLARLEAGDGGADSCVLLGDATVTVSGKLAQFGGRLLVPVADAMLAQFAKTFEATAAAVQLAVAPATTPPEAAPAVAEAAPESSPAPTRAANDEPSPAPVEAAAKPALAASPVRAVAPVAAPANELNALGLLWAVIRGWFMGLFGKKTA